MVRLLISLLILSGSARTLAGLEQLEAVLREELELINYPAASWREEQGPIDVVIVGGGMSGFGDWLCVA